MIFLVQIEAIFINFTKIFYFYDSDDSMGRYPARRGEGIFKGIGIQLLITFI